MVKIDHENICLIEWLILDNLLLIKKEVMYLQVYNVQQTCLVNLFVISVDIIKMYTSFMIW